MGRFQDIAQFVNCLDKIILLIEIFYQNCIDKFLYTI